MKSSTVNLERRGGGGVKKILYTSRRDHVKAALSQQKSTAPSPPPSTRITTDQSLNPFTPKISLVILLSDIQFS